MISLTILELILWLSSVHVLIYQCQIFFLDAIHYWHIPDARCLCKNTHTKTKSNPLSTFHNSTHWSHYQFHFLFNVLCSVFVNICFNMRNNRARPALSRVIRLFYTWHLSTKWNEIEMPSVSGSLWAKPGCCGCPAWQSCHWLLSCEGIFIRYSSNQLQGSVLKISSPSGRLGQPLQPL